MQTGCILSFNLLIILTVNVESGLNIENDDQDTETGRTDRVTFSQPASVVVGSIYPPASHKQANYSYESTESTSIKPKPSTNSIIAKEGVRNPTKAGRLTVILVIGICMILLILFVAPLVFCCYYLKTTREIDAVLEKPTLAKHKFPAAEEKHQSKTSSRRNMAASEQKLPYVIAKNVPPNSSVFLIDQKAPASSSAYIGQQIGTGTPSIFIDQPGAAGSANVFTKQAISPEAPGGMSSAYIGGPPLPPTPPYGTGTNAFTGEQEITAVPGPPRTESAYIGDHGPASAGPTGPAPSTYFGAGEQPMAKGVANPCTEGPNKNAQSEYMG